MDFKAKKTKPLLKLMVAFSERSGLNRKYLRFVCDGKRIYEHDTPESVGLLILYLIVNITYSNNPLSVIY